MTVAQVDRVEIVGNGKCGVILYRDDAVILPPIVCPKWFVVVLIESGGERSMVTGGPSYEQAIFEAERCAAAWRVRVLDRVDE